MPSIFFSRENGKVCCSFVLMNHRNSLLSKEKSDKYTLIYTIKIHNCCTSAKKREKKCELCFHYNFRISTQMFIGMKKKKTSSRMVTNAVNQSSKCSSGRVREKERTRCGKWLPKWYCFRICEYSFRCNLDFNC